MKKNEVIKRWLIGEGIVVRGNVLKALSSGETIAKVKGISKYEGKWDLRGIQFPNPKGSETITAGTSSFRKVSGTFNLKNIDLKNVDFSYADMSHSVWIRSNLENCIFNNTKAKNLYIKACHFADLVAFKTNFSESFMAQNIGNDSGSYRNVVFNQCDLSKTSFSFPLIDHCNFFDCKLHEVNFDGSRFENCKFSGVFKSGWIRGYSIYAQKSILGLFNKVNLKDFPNTMTNVDFKEAELKDVLFSHEVDISRCKFPVSENLIVIKNLDVTFSKIREVVSNRWEGEDRRQALFLIDNLYYSDMKKGMKMDVISTSFNNYLTIDFQNKFFDIIRSHLDDEIDLSHLV
ncbi:MAG: hypothetical protein JWQ25_2586 [Daejeonella sp.]|nr:hypothetical protein [Daejeonella sp.]